MNFVIISHVVHKLNSENISAYEPYVREMNLWLKYVDKVTIVAPATVTEPNTIEIPYQHQNIEFKKIPEIQFTSLKHILKSIILLPSIFIQIFKACKNANHIHLRCPGNIGLLGCFVQVLFPNKIKTAKYAGNWDPKAKQPFSYKLQKWILSNTFLTRNIKVLVYGKWMNQTKNIKEFFTATYRESEIVNPQKKNYSGKLKFVFIGSLVRGKQPLFAIQIIEALQKEGIQANLDIYGNGLLKAMLQKYIKDNKLEKIVVLHGNQSKKIIKESLKTAHFSLLASKSEGWPKAVAEAMFFGVIPIATPVSCVPFMLDHGCRGILIKGDLIHDMHLIIRLLGDIDALQKMALNALTWSQEFTLDKFEEQINKLLQ